MVDISAIGSALASLKAAKDIAEAMIGLRDAAAFQQKQIEFQSKIIDANNAAFAAQEERSTMLDRIRELEAKVAKFEAWEAEKQRYKLHELPPGVFVYVLKPEMAAGEPPHRLCAACLNSGKKAILQSHGTSEGIEGIHCDVCKGHWNVGHYQPTPMPRYAEDDRI